MNDADKKDLKQIMTDVLVNFWESVFPTLATKEDLKQLATKDDLNKLEHKVDILARDVKEIRGRVIDVEGDTPTKSELIA